MSTDTNLTKTNENLPEEVRDQRFVMPPVDIYENDNEILLLADVPGVAKKDLNLSVDSGELTINAQRSSHQTGAMLFQGYEELDYKRAFKLPNTIDHEKIDAQLKDGILTVHLPKLEAVRPRRIEVKAS